MSSDQLERDLYAFEFFGKNDAPLEEMVGGILEIPGSNPLRLLIELKEGPRVVAETPLSDFRAAAADHYPPILLVNGVPFEFSRD